ncbi:hypothetical protein [Sinorhizobium fredii]|uniref:hypothetical protein n=1 Tax=Rhizobium fredii TaxID=380 RepID=UPI00059570E9|nr:hypothetical protein [Sinorhizobium fredii]WOS66707.1 hypothetical protein SFGR64A_23910 [Sinorhizobium fredii GR64]
MQRKLAAILAADVVGDRPEIRRPQRPCGQVMGDGELIEVPSVVDAVRCAVEIQQAMAECNEELPLGKRLEFRSASTLVTLSSKDRISTATA